MRMRQSKPDYLQKEEANDHEWCWRELVAVLVKNAVPQAQARREAQQMFKHIAQGVSESFVQYHVRWDRVCLMAEKHKVLPSEGELLTKYLDSTLVYCSKHLERH